MIQDRLRFYIETVLKQYQKKEIAKILNTSESQLSRNLNGPFAPGYEILCKIVKLGVSINWLITGNGSIFADDEYGDKALTDFISYLQIRRKVKLNINATFKNVIKDINYIFGSKENFYIYLTKKNIDFDKDKINISFGVQKDINGELEKVLNKIDYLFLANIQSYETANAFKNIIKNVYDHQQLNTNELVKAKHKLEKIIEHLDFSIDVITMDL